MRTAQPSDWKTEDIPSKRTTISLGRGFSSEEMDVIQRGIVPEQMEDKWFVYWKDGSLFFHRSWTGYCVYIVRFATEGDGWKMIEADLNRDPEQHGVTNDERDAELISYLLDVVLLHRDAIFPSEEPSSDKSTLINWSLIGRAMLGKHPGDADLPDQLDPSG